MESHTDEFNEEIVSRKQDALDGHSSTPFPYAELDPREDAIDPDYIELFDKLEALIKWVLNRRCDTLQDASDKAIGRRFIAAAWCISPKYFDGDPSLRKLAARLGYSAPILSILTAEFTREFGVKNRAQSHGDGKRKGKEPQ